MAFFIRLTTAIGDDGPPQTQIAFHNLPGSTNAVLHGDMLQQFMMALLHESHPMFLPQIVPPSPTRVAAKDVDALPRVRMTERLLREHPKCPICLDAFKRGGSAVRTPCNHYFHLVCARTWLQEHHNTCPICRQAIGGEHGASGESTEISTAASATRPAADEPVVQQRPRLPREDGGQDAVLVYPVRT